MLYSKLCEYKELHDKNNVLMSFTGPFSQGIIEEIGEIIKIYINIEKASKSRIYDVFSIYIEQAQNIKNYFQSKKNKKLIYQKIFNSGIIIIEKIEKNYFILSGNLIENKDVFSLQNKLDIINTLDKIELKQFYKKFRKSKKQIRDSKFGLGLIEIGKRSKGELSYSFNKIDNEFTFFSLKIKI